LIVGKKVSFVLIIFGCVLMFLSSNKLDDDYNDVNLSLFSSFSSLPSLESSTSLNSPINSSTLNVIDDGDDFFSKMVDDLFHENDFLNIPNQVDPSSPYSSIPSTPQYSSIPFHQTFDENSFYFSPENGSSDQSDGLIETSSIAYPAPAPLSVIPNSLVTRKRSRDIPEVCESDQNELNNKRHINKREKVEVPIKIEVYKPKKSFIGVTYHAPSKRYRARIKIDNKTTHLGYFLTEYEAAIAYDRAAWELRGTKAHLNFDSSAGISFGNPNLPIRERCITAAKSAAGVAQAF